jgi:hypothetical protein
MQPVPKIEPVGPDAPVASADSADAKRDKVLGELISTVVVSEQFTARRCDQEDWDAYCLSTHYRASTQVMSSTLRPLVSYHPYLTKKRNWKRTSGAPNFHYQS